MTDFKPGDVVVHPVHGRGVVTVGGYVEFSDDACRTLFEGLGTHLRRLVVLDAEDREQVERLLAAYYMQCADREHGDLADALQTALREFADPAPVKPPEPTGLGAVIEAVCGCNDGDAGRYVYEPQSARYEGRPHGQEHPWKSKCGHHTYDRLTAVAVLSEGVQS